MSARALASPQGGPIRGQYPLLAAAAGFRDRHCSTIGTLAEPSQRKPSDTVLPAAARVRFIDALAAIVVVLNPAEATDNLHA